MGTSLDNRERNTIHFWQRLNLWNRSRRDLSGQSRAFDDFFLKNHEMKEKEVELKTILTPPLLVSHLNTFFRLLYLFSLQPIDVRNNILLNVITFPPLGSFEVQASIRVASPQRINFEWVCLDQLRKLHSAYCDSWLEEQVSIDPIFVSRCVNGGWQADYGMWWHDDSLTT